MRCLGVRLHSDGLEQLSAETTVRHVKSMHVELPMSKKSRTKW